MEKVKNPNESWQVFAGTATGGYHIYNKLACEDASYAKTASSYRILAAADGHGAPYCFRAERGSRFAVQAAREVLQKVRQESLAQDITRWFAEIRLQENLCGNIARWLVARWQQLVREDLKDHPLTVSELRKSGLSYAQANDPVMQTLFYGTTLLCALITDQFCLILQQGDGRAITVSKDGDILMPVPWDERCKGSLTTSLCDEDAAQSMRWYFAAGDDMPAGVFLCSDGVENSFKNQEEFIAFIRDFLLDASAQPDTLTADSIHMIEEFAMHRSRDDVSLAFAFRQGAAAALRNRLNQEKQLDTIKAELSRVRMEMHRLSDRKNHFEEEGNQEGARRCLHQYYECFRRKEQLRVTYETEKRRLCRIIHQKRQVLA